MSTQIQIASSGGILGPHNLNGYIPTSAGTDTAITGTGVGGGYSSTANTLVSLPFIPNKAVTSQSMRIQVSSASAGALARLLIYSSNNGLPNSKLYESTDIDCATLGSKIIANVFTFNAGTTYFLSLHTNNSGIGFVGLSAGSVIPLWLQAAGLNTANPTMFSTSVPLGSAPSTYTYSTFVASSVPRIGIYI